MLNKVAAKRDKHITERDRKLISEFYLKGYSNRQIAELVSNKFSSANDPYSISHVTVSKDIKWLLNEWKKSTLLDLEEIKTRELEKLNTLEQTYWMAWEKSIEDYEKKAKKVKGLIGTDTRGNPLKPSEQELQTTHMLNFGNPSYLAGIERCIDRRCKLLGIDAPQKMDVTSGGKEIKGITSIEVVHVSKEEFDKRNEDASNSGVRPDSGSIQRKQL